MDSISFLSAFVERYREMRRRHRLAEMQRIQAHLHHVRLLGTSKLRPVHRAHWKPYNEQVLPDHTAVLNQSEGCLRRHHDVRDSLHQILLPRSVVFGRLQIPWSLLQMYRSHQRPRGRQRRQSAGRQLPGLRGLCPLSTAWVERLCLRQLSWLGGSVCLLGWGWSLVVCRVWRIVVFFRTYSFLYETHKIASIIIHWAWHQPACLHEKMFVRVTREISIPANWLAKRWYTLLATTLYMVLTAPNMVVRVPNMVVTAPNMEWSCKIWELIISSSLLYFICCLSAAVDPKNPSNSRRPTFFCCFLSKFFYILLKIWTFLLHCKDVCCWGVYDCI